MFFLSGLPRTGSTLLSSILSQNPEIHAEGNSAVCQLMWDTQLSFETSSYQQIAANNKFHIQDRMVSSIPSIYYSDVKTKYIVDKSRSWTLPKNLEMIKRYITKDPKILVMIRPVEEILESFAKLRKKNGWKKDPYMGLLDKDSEPIMRPLYGVEYAEANNNGEFLFIQYKDLCNNPEKVLKNIYKFFEIENFDHDFNNVVCKFPEDDSVYGLEGMHTIRPKVEKISDGGQ